MQPAPTDDEIRRETKRALTALRAEVERALKEPKPDPTLTLDIARQYRSLHVSALMALNPGGTADLVSEEMARARGLVVSILGESAWDEPTRPDLPPPPAFGGKQ
jgi:hypothetical protein